MRIQIIDNYPSKDETKCSISGIEVNKNIITLREPVAYLLFKAFKVAEDCRATVEIRRSECVVIVTPEPRSEAG